MIQRTNRALGVACRTDVPAKMDKAVAETGLLGGFDDLFQSHLHLVGIFAAVFGGEAQLVADTDAVGVGNDGRVTVNIRQDQIGRLSTDTGQLEQLLHGVGHHAAVLLQQHDGGIFNIVCLSAEQAAGLDDLAEFFQVG